MQFSPNKNRQFLYYVAAFLEQEQENLKKFQPLFPGQSSLYLTQLKLVLALNELANLLAFRTASMIDVFRILNLIQRLSRAIYIKKRRLERRQEDEQLLSAQQNSISQILIDINTLWDDKKFREMSHAILAHMHFVSSQEKKTLETLKMVKKTFDKVTKFFGEAAKNFCPTFNRFKESVSYHIPRFHAQKGIPSPLYPYMRPPVPKAHLSMSRCY